jgi:hypothetical protein
MKILCQLPLRFVSAQLLGVPFLVLLLSQREIGAIIANRAIGSCHGLKVVEDGGAPTLMHSLVENGFVTFRFDLLAFQRGVAF